MTNTLVEFNNWLTSDDGRGCLTTSCEINEAVLYNRLRQAFYAGKEVNNFDKMKEALNRVVEDSESEDYFGGISNATFKEIKQLLESIK